LFFDRVMKWLEMLDYHSVNGGDTAGRIQPQFFLFVCLCPSFPYPDGNSPAQLLELTFSSSHLKENQKR